MGEVALSAAIAGVITGSAFLQSHMIHGHKGFRSMELVAFERLHSRQQGREGFVFFTSACFLLA